MGINNPDVAMIVRTVSFMMIPPFSAFGTGSCDGLSMIPVTTSRLSSQFSPFACYKSINHAKMKKIDYSLENYKYI